MLTKVLVFSKDYPEAATYRGEAERLDLVMGNIGLAPTVEQLEAAAIGAANQRQYRLLRINIYFEEGFPTRTIYYEIYGYPVVTTAVGIVVIAAIIIAILLSLALVVWVFGESATKIIWGPTGVEGIIPWGAIVILAIVGVAAYFLITQKEKVTRAIEVVGKPVARRVEAL